MQRRPHAQARRDLAPVDLRHVAFERDHRKHHAAHEVLMPALADDAQPLQTPAQFRAFLPVAIRQPITQRTIGEADLKAIDDLRMREPARLQIAQRFGLLLQSRVMERDHLLQRLLVISVRADRRVEPPTWHFPRQCHRFVLGDTTSDGILSS